MTNGNGWRKQSRKELQLNEEQNACRAIANKDEGEQHTANIDTPHLLREVLALVEIKQQAFRTHVSSASD
jgi:hypothetical protein